jgi:hypothetical protein
MVVIFFNPKSFFKVILTLEKVGLKLLQQFTVVFL